MTENETYFIPLIVGVISLILSSYIPRYGYKRWNKFGAFLGCLIQSIVLVCFMVLITTPYSLFRGCQQEGGTMLCIRNVEEDRDCRFEEMWYLKSDGSISYHFDKESNDHHVEPCGNDSYWERLDVSFARNDSVPILTYYHIGDIKIYFDLDEHKVTPTFNNDTIEVISVNWDMVEQFFNSK